MAAFMHRTAQRTDDPWAHKASRQFHASIGPSAAPLVVPSKERLAMNSDMAQGAAHHGGGIGGGGGGGHHDGGICGGCEAQEAAVVETEMGGDDAVVVIDDLHKVYPPPLLQCRLQRCR